jgi:RIO kinase 1
VRSPALLRRWLHAERRVCSHRAAAEDDTANLVFKGSFIPRRLDEVAHFERDAARIATGGDTEGIYYQTVTGLASDLSGVRLVPSLLTPASGSDAHVGEAPADAAPAAAEAGAAASADESSSSSSDTDSDSDAGASGEEGVPRTWSHRPDAPTREEVREQRRLNKDAVKEAKRERRKTKIPKGKKKRMVKAGSGKK